MRLIAGLVSVLFVGCGGDGGSTGGTGGTGGLPQCDYQSIVSSMFACAGQPSACTVPTTLGVYNCGAVPGTCMCTNGHWSCVAATEGARCALPNGTSCFTEGNCMFGPPPDMYFCQAGYWTLHHACDNDAAPLDAGIVDGGTD